MFFQEPYNIIGLPRGRPISTRHSNAVVRVSGSQSTCSGGITHARLFPPLPQPSLEGCCCSSYVVLFWYLRSMASGSSEAAVLKRSAQEKLLASVAHQQQKEQLCVPNITTCAAHGSYMKCTNHHHAGQCF